MTLSLSAKIEALLFAATSPMTARQIAKILEVKEQEVSDALAELSCAYQDNARGLTIIQREKEVILGTKKEAAEFLSAFLKEEAESPLTRPQLEALTIIAYRSPVSKTELELIRGVNCSLILRNLLLRGLIEEKDDPTLHTPVYRPSFEFLRFLGVLSVEALPQYEELHKHPDIEAVLQQENAAP